MQIFHSVMTMQQQALDWRASGERIVCVPTMGSLHAGHAALLRAARPRGSKLLLSVFVNPTQFGPTEDFARYPRTWEADQQLARDYMVDGIFAPTADDMYPDGCATVVHPGPLADGLCGAIRPGHFQGVATVVLKLFQLMQPHVALFGEKDYQQLCIIRQMMADFNLPIDIVGVPTVRESDGLALSSRNAYLSPAERERAAIIPDTLLPLTHQHLRGVATAQLISRIVATFAAANLAHIDYIAVVDATTLAPLTTIDRPARLCVAVRVGNTRLIDNIAIG